MFKSTTTIFRWSFNYKINSYLMGSGLSKITLHYHKKFKETNLEIRNTINNANR